MDKNKQEKASIFEDFVYDYFIDNLKFNLSHYSSKPAQFKRGENRQGIEIKNDNLYNIYGNLFISVERRMEWGEVNGSGIFRETDTEQLLYVIGDEYNFWVLATKHLRAYYEKHQPELFGGFKTPKSRDYGYKLPIGVADRMCIHKYTNQTKLNLSE